MDRPDLYPDPGETKKIYIKSYSRCFISMDASAARIVNPDPQHFGLPYPDPQRRENRIEIKMKSRKLWRLTMAFHFDEDPSLH